MPFQSQQQCSTPLSSAPSPELCEDNRRKRKSSVEDDGQEDLPLSSDGRHPPDKKTTHSMIEKRYRTNLNDKIAALRDSVPSLTQEDLRDLKLAHKLNKATVLSKATEYIKHLEKRNKSLTKKNASLNSQLTFRDPRYETPIIESEATRSTS